MLESSLPNRHRYAAEIEGYRPGIFRRILLALRLVKRPMGVAKANWHYSDLDLYGSIERIYYVRDGQRCEMPIFIPPEHKSPVIKHV